MKILVTGAGGMLGSDLVQKLHSRFPVVGIGRRQTDHLSVPSYHYYHQDLAHFDELSEIIVEEKPDLIFHAAAMTDVDGCEKQREKALRDNFEVTRNMVRTSNGINALLVFFSTDYVFDGRKHGEYEESDAPHPLNYYGETKYLAEEYIQEKATQFVIFRTSWLYGFNGKSFPRTILEMADKGHRPFKVVADQAGRPTFTQDIAETFLKLLTRDEMVLHRINRQIFHLANDGVTSWADFARMILEIAGYGDIPVESIKSTELNREAARPLNSVLSLKKTEERLGIRLRKWQDAIREFIELLEKKGISKLHGSR